MPIIKKISLFLLFSFTGIWLWGARLVILNTTDLHGHISGRRDGILRIASLINEQKQKYPADSLLIVDCGDTIQGTFSSMVYKGALMVKILNFLKYDAWIIGNHEFDYGLEVLRKRTEEFSGVSLAANIEYSSLEKSCKAWQMYHKDGMKIALIGITLPGMQKLMLLMNKDFATVNAEKALKHIMPEVRAAKPDIIILAQHLGIYSKSFSVYKLAAKFPEIDLIIGAHSHIPEPGRKIGPGTWYFQEGKNGDGLGRIIIDYDEKHKKLIRINSEIIPVTADTPVCEQLLEYIKPDLKKIKKIAEKKICTIIFKNTAGLDSSFLEQEIIGRAMLAESGADVAFCNAYPSNYKLTGKVSVTMKRLYYWCRFDNTLCTLVLDKAVFNKILAEQQSLSKKHYHTAVTYADSDSFKNRNKVIAAFSNYALSGAGGRFPLLEKIAGDKKYMLKNTNIIIRKSLERYLKGKEFVVSFGVDKKIKIEQKSK